MEHVEIEAHCPTVQTNFKVRLSPEFKLENVFVYHHIFCYTEVLFLTSHLLMVKVNEVLLENQKLVQSH